MIAQHNSSNLARAVQRLESVEQKKGTLFSVTATYTRNLITRLKGPFLFHWIRWSGDLIFVDNLWNY